MRIRRNDFKGIRNRSEIIAILREMDKSSSPEIYLQKLIQEVKLSATRKTMVLLFPYLTEICLKSQTIELVEFMGHYEYT